MRISLIGDSHAQALWPRVTAALSGQHDVVNSIAQPGWSEAKYLSSWQLPGIFAAARPDLVVYELGGNNQALNASAYRPTVESLVRLAREQGAQVLWVGPATAYREPWASAHEATANLQKSILPGLGVTWLDSRGVTQSAPHSADGVHLQPAGYDAWARAITSTIQGLAPNRRQIASREEGNTAGVVLGLGLLLGAAFLIGSELQAKW
jgi:lysophospholipase L1-like esterase